MIQSLRTRRAPDVLVAGELSFIRGAEIGETLTSVEPLRCEQIDMRVCASAVG